MARPVTPTESTSKGRPGRGQPPAIDKLPKELRDKCIDLLLSGRKGCGAEVARIAGVSRQAVNEYRNRHVKQALEIAGKLARAESSTHDVTAQMARTAQVTKDVAGILPILAVREKRLTAQQDRHDRMSLVMAERALDMASVPGGKSGLLVRQLKQIGSGANAETVEEYKLDTGLLSEFREHEKQIAQELGQWQEGTPNQTNIMIVCPAGAPEPAVSLDRDAVVIDIGPKR